MTKAQAIQTKPADSLAIPSYLIKETLDGVPLYYKGYKDVINQTKTLEDIMGSSSLQAEIISCLLQFLFKNLNLTKYRVYTNEIGSHINHKNNLSHDIAIFDKTVLTTDKINVHYTDVPAKMVIEVDIDIEPAHELDWDYLTKKTATILEFGTEKVIWILTKSQKVMIAQPSQDWLLVDWNKDIELLDGHSFNIGRYLEQEGIQLEQSDEA
ncbi:MAG: Uma2 family endonuclease [Saprospiraceae bacterium]|nr:Uma2 family endonuclease [Saprospiraceae bacterium]